MKKTLLFCLSLCLGLNILAQSKFEKGYFIKNDGTKVECLIQNDDWRNTPTQFQYQLGEGTTIITGNLGSTTEFSVGTSHKYRKFTVNIDRSSKRLREISKKRTPDFKEETLFLRVLVEGESASLYGYTDGDLRRYFYETPATKVNQLIYKFYQSENGGLRKNEAFKAQLQKELKCSTPQSKVYYTRPSLIKYFINYNNCKNSDNPIVDYTRLETKAKLRFKVKGGLSLFNTDIRDTRVVLGDPDGAISYKLNPRVAVELEYQFRLNNNRWAVFTELAYHPFSGEAEFDLDNIGNTFFREVDYNHMELPIGLRYYFPLENSDKLFINGGYTFNFPLSSTFDGMDIEPSGNGFFGIGYEFNTIYGLEFRYNLSHELLKNSNRFEVNQAGFLLQFSYSL